MSGTDWETLPEVRKWSEALPEVPKWSRDRPGCPQLVGRLSWRSGTGRETFQKYGTARETPWNVWKWLEALPEVQN